MLAKDDKIKLKTDINKIAISQHMLNSNNISKELVMQRFLYILALYSIKHANYIKFINNYKEESIYDKFFKYKTCYYLITCDDEVLEYLAKTQSEYIYVSGYEDINLQSFLNLQSSFKSRLNMVY